MMTTMNMKITGLAIAATLYCGLLSADINITGFGNSLIQTPQFENPENPSGDKLRFNYGQTGDQSSLGTCTMNPMSSNNVEVLIDELPVKEPEVYVAVQDYGMSVPNSETPKPPVPNRPNNNNEEPPPPENSVPEPATMLIVGLGLAGLLPLRKRLRMTA